MVSHRPLATRALADLRRPLSLRQPGRRRNPRLPLPPSEIAACRQPQLLSSPAPSAHHTGRRPRPPPRWPPDPGEDRPDLWTPTVVAAGEAPAAGEVHRNLGGRTRLEGPVEGEEGHATAFIRASRLSEAPSSAATIATI